MDTLTQTLNNLRGNIIRLKKRGQPIGEANTKANLIEPLLTALGWNTTNIDEVVREFKLSQRYNPVDYALLLDEEPCLFIEAKALKHSLDDVKWVKQTVNYANNAGIEWCVLTNGNDYHIYRSNAPVSLERKLFKKITITQDVSKAERVLSLLTKENLAKGTLNSQWDIYFARTALKTALIDTLKTPPYSLIASIREKTNLKPAQIRTYLATAKIDIELPESQSVPSARKTGEGKKSKKGFGHISVQTLIEKGLLHPPCQIFTSYRGKRLEASIERDGIIVFQGQRYRSLSLAGGHARNTIIGPPKDGRKFHQTNGWIFWKTEDEKGKIIEMHEFRVRASKL
jgi:predicted type IV restriction endonuclease